MKQEYTHILTRFDISPTAAKVYIALLELGKASADKIAKKVGTYKANVYEALDRLFDNGLATYMFEGKKKLYLATNPEKLIDAAEEAKEKAVEEYMDLKEDIQRIMPELTAKYLSVKEKNLFEVYHGSKGYKALIADILREKPKYWKGFGNLQVQEFFPYDFPRWFKRTKFRLFSTTSGDMTKRLKEAQKTTKVEVRWLPQDLYMPIVWTLFGENLLILIYEPEILALRIKSRQIVDTFSNQFDYLWNKHARAMK